MKKYIIIAISLAGMLCSATAMAQTTESASGITVANPEMIRNEGLMSVSMDLELSALELTNNRAAVFTPVIINGDKSLELPAVGIYGRTRWYQYIRTNASPLSGEEEMSYRYSKRPSHLEYRRNIPYEDWMNGAHLEVRRSDYGCCNTILAQSGAGISLGEWAVYMPRFNYIKPVAETSKVRELSASAYIDYPVDRTDIRPDYRNNSSELNKITATIDSLRADKDITISSLRIKGFASPEGDYSHNEKLAKGRTEALKNYVDNLYKFGEGFIETSYEAEDWEGLRRQVAESNLPHKSEISAIIDDASLQPDAKERHIKTSYPEDYKVMLNTYYPALRHSDYYIEYSVRSYENVETIREVMATAPQKLSLNEMYLLAQTYEAGSDEFNNIFETAVRMYPDDETANLNAANAAMGRGDLRRAERYLAKAGNSAEAEYARGILEKLRDSRNN